MINREYEPRNFQAHARRVDVGNAIIPHLKKNESFPITIAPFQDHGKPSFIGSAIRSHPVILEIARSLTPEESRKANDRLSMEMEKILDGDSIRRVSTLSAQDKSDIFILSVGESFDPRGLRIYYTIGEFNKAPAMFLQAIARLKDATKVERVFEDAGYRGTKNWESRKVH